MRCRSAPKAIGNRDLSLVLFKLPICLRLSLGTFVGNVILAIVLVDSSGGLRVDLGRRWVRDERTMDDRPVTLPPGGEEEGPGDHVETDPVLE